MNNIITIFLLVFANYSFAQVQLSWKDLEDVEFSDEESYTEKLKTIRESYFGSKEVLTEEGTEETSTEQTVEVTDSMDKYLKAIGRDVQRAKQ